MDGVFHQWMYSLYSSFSHGKNVKVLIPLLLQNNAYTLIYLILCILINSLIGVVFKLFSKYHIDNLQAIIINYLVCSFCGLLLLGEVNFIEAFMKQTWTPVALFLGFLFIIIFNAYARAVQESGVGVATIFQKMSLIAPVLFAILLYGESVTIHKIGGLTFSVFALFMLSISKSEHLGDRVASGLKILLIVFLGSCVIDVLLFLTEAESLAPDADVGFVSAIFFFAMIFGILFQSIIQRKKMEFNQRSVVAGIFLGLPNFFSIYLLLKVLSLGWEGSVVFPANNVGVLSLAALFGVLLFQEKVTARKILGFASALTAIILLSYNAS